ncbi:MAG: hypothetical protein K6G71_09055, partial [Clostridiales bacterium]|nr:hypothetical protein [Clostridiales bacterium]
MCAKDGRRPKFYELLDYHPDGRYSMKEDGSTDGYWKLLIDFKMYDNDGNGAEQMPVRPIFNMGGTGNAEMDAHSITAALDAYKGGHDNFPVAKDVVKKFIEYKTGKTVSDEEVDDAIKRSKGRPRRTGEMKMSRNYSAAQDRNALIEEYKKPVTREDVDRLHELFKKRKSINKFTPDEIRAVGKWAYKYWQQMGAKSPFFRAWFGDWRAQDTAPIEIADIPDVDEDAFAKYIKDRRSEEGIENPDTTWLVATSSQGERNTKSHSGTEGLSVKALTGISDLIKKAVLLDSEVHEHHNNNAKSAETDPVAFDHRLYALGQSDIGGTALYRITVEEIYENAKDPNDKRFHNLKYIEKIAENIGSLTRGTDRDAESTNDEPTIDYNIADIYSFVKNYDGDFNAGREVAPELLNEDRTPRKFYHGTGEKFTEFDITKSRSWEGSPDYDLPGFYFTADERAARDYGETGAYYLTADKVWRTTSDGDLYSLKKKYGSYRAAYDALVGQGYDMVIVDDGDSADNEYIVLKGENVKSATDNIGTYNRGESDIRLSRKSKSDNKFLKTEIQESREKLDDAIDSMALGTKTNYEPAEKRIDRDERRALMINYKSVAAQGVRKAEEAVAEILETDTALKETLREAQRQTKLSKDIGYVLSPTSIKKASAAIRNAHPEITAQEAKVVTFGRGESATLYDTDDPFYQDGKAMIVSFDQDSLFDGDRVHEATSIHLGSTLEGTLVHLPGSATVFVKNENELVRATRKADILSRVHSAVKLVGQIAQEDADVKSENAIKDSRMASQDAEFNKKLEEAGMAYDGETGTILHSRMYSTGQENAARVNRSKLVGM